VLLLAAVAPRRAFTVWLVRVPATDASRAIQIEATLDTLGWRCASPAAENARRAGDEAVVLT
jgi:hypothetical protein